MIFGDWFGRQRTLTPGDKKRLLLKARGKCEYCGRNIIAEGVREEIHHIRPFAEGGSDRESNLIVLCPNCHSRAELISVEEFKKKISYRLPKKKAETSAKAAVKAKVAPKRKTAAKAKVAPKRKTAAKAKVAPKRKTVAKAQAKTRKKTTVKTKAKPKKTTVKARPKAKK